MVFLRSVVGKLWFTILLLVSFVLLILTVLLLEFFENFNTQQVENDLAATAVRVVKILEEHDASERTLELSSRMLDDSKDILIVRPSVRLSVSLACRNRASRKVLTASDRYSALTTPF